MLRCARALFRINANEHTSHRGPFEGSGQVGHAKEEPERHWEAVVATWGASYGSEKIIPQLEVNIEDVDFEIFTHATGKANHKWSDVDSQRYTSARVTPQFLWCRSTHPCSSLILLVSTACHRCR